MDAATENESMSQGEQQELKPSEPQQGIRSWTPHVLSISLRSITCVAAWVAFYLTITSKQTKTINLGIVQITERAKWQYAGAFSFHLIANAIVGSYAVLTTLVAILVATTRYKSGSRAVLWTLLVLDLVMGYLQMAAVAAAMAVAVIGKNGNSHTNWQPICGMFPGFCDRVQWALVAAAIAFFTLAESTILDVYNLYKYQIAPKLGSYVSRA